MNRLEDRINEGTLVVDQDGHMLSQQPNGEWQRIGHVGNNRGNVVIKYRDDEGQVRELKAGRVAWRIHHGYWPPSDMSVLTLNKVKDDFRRVNLALVPQGQENRAHALLAA